MLELGVLGARSPEALGRMWAALMLVTSELGVAGVGMGGRGTRAAGGVGGISSAAARHDIASPSAASEEAGAGVGVAVVSAGVEVELAAGAEAGSEGGRGGSGLLLGLAAGGTTGGEAGAVLGGGGGVSVSAEGAGGAVSPFEVTPSLSPAVSLSPPSLLGSSDSVLAEPLDLVDSCLRRVPDSRGSVNWVVLLT